MIKADLARVVYETHGGISQRESRELVETMIQLIKDRLTGGETVKLAGFGSLKVVNRKGRLGRNPKTGDRIRLNSSRYVSFRPSRILKF